MKQVPHLELKNCWGLLYKI